jgi:hypothetical protein
MKRAPKRKPTATDTAFHKGRADAFLEIASECDNSFKDGEWHPWASRVARTFGEMCRELSKEALTLSGGKGKGKKCK